jgi:hypothetical protein
MPKSKKIDKQKRTLTRKIINVFIGIFIGIIVLLLLIFGFSQTSTFREMLRDEIVSQVNESVNGKLYIEKIEGTLFTSLFLMGTSLIVDRDTLLSARSIEIVTSPLQLLLKKLYFRKIELQDVHIYLHEDENGSWNLSKLIKTSDETIIEDEEEIREEKDSDFPFIIQVNDLALKNVNFVRQSFENQNSNEEYQTVNTNDLRIQNISLSIKFIADLNTPDINIFIDNIAGYPNFQNFSLKKLSGRFLINKDFTSVQDLNITTDSSQININARINNLNLLGKIDLKDFENYDINLHLETEPFNFYDLTSFIGDTKILNGSPYLDLTVNGKFGDFNIEELVIDYFNTHLELEGSIQKLHTPENMFMDVRIFDSYIVQSDVLNILPQFSIPSFDQLFLNNLNIDFKGEPTNFEANLTADLAEGNLDVNTKLNLKNNPIEYDVEFSTTAANLEPVFHHYTKLNSKGKLVGKGTNPTNLNANFEFGITDSRVGDHSLDSLNLNTNAISKKLNLNFGALVDGSEISIDGELDLTEQTVTIYDLNGNVSGLDLAKILKDSTYNSNLNFSYFAKGQGLDVDSMTGNFKVTLDSSRFNETEINDVGLELVLKRNDQEREINLNSDLIDFNINGSFSLQKAVELLSYEAEMITKIVTDKMEEINPLLIAEDTLRQDILYIPDDIVSNELEFEYDFQFKDLNLLATFIQEDKLDISGSGYGKVKNNQDNFSISTSINFDHIIRKNNSGFIYLSDFETDLNFSRDNKSTSFNNLLGSVSITGNRFNSGADINNIYADIIFNQSKLFFNIEAELDTILTSAAEGTVEMSAIDQKVILENLECNYKGINWQNENPITVLFTPEFFNIKDFSLNNNDTKIKLDGTIYNEETQKVSIRIDNLPGEYLSKYFLALNKNYIDANINASININGSFDNPLIDVQLNADSITYQRINFGNLLSDISYDNKLIKSEVYFVDTTNNLNSPLLEMSSTIPLDLRFREVSKRFLDNEELSLFLKASNFNSSAFGDLLPFITNQKGLLTADINGTGTLDDLNVNGFLSLTEGRFTARLNNLNYDYGLSLLFEENLITVDSLLIKNSGGSKYTGTLNGSGKIKLSGTNIEDINLFVDGDLALLGKRSRAVSPTSMK